MEQWEVSYKLPLQHFQSSSYPGSTDPFTSIAYKGSTSHAWKDNKTPATQKSAILLF